MFDKLVGYVKSAREVLETVYKKRSAEKPNEEKAQTEPQATTEKVEAPAGDPSLKKPGFPVTPVVILAAILVAALYVEWHLLAIASGIWLVLILLAYLIIQKAIDAGGLAIPDPGDKPGPDPTPDDMGGYQGA